MQSPKKLTSLNIRGLGDPLVISQDGKASLIALQEIEILHAVQINIYGDDEPKLLSLNALENPKYQDLEKTVAELRDRDQPLQTFERVESGLPLVLYDPENRTHSLVSFGRTYKPESKEGLKVDYLGPLQVLRYEERRQLPLDVANAATDNLIRLNRTLKYRELDKSHKKTKRRMDAA